MDGTALRARPHTPRRLGTTHEPHAADVAHSRAHTPRGACDADELVGEAAELQKLHPAYWADSGKHSRLRPGSAPSKRPLVPSLALTPCVPSASTAALVVSPRVVGVLAFSKPTSRSSRRPSSATQEVCIDAGRAYAAAAPLISPRTRGFDLSVAPLRYPPAIVRASATPVPTPPPRHSDGSAQDGARDPHVPTPRLNSMTSRVQANYARGVGPCPTVCYYQAVLQEEAGISAAHHLRSNDEVEAHLQTFVDEQDHRYTVGMRGATVRRAKVVVRQRGYAPESSQREVAEASGPCTPRGFDMARVIGRDPGTRKKAPWQQAVSPSRASGTSNTMAGSTVHPTPMPPMKHTAAIVMAKTTGREAPVSTVLCAPTGDAGTCAAGSPRTVVDTTARHVPRIDFSRMRPRSAAAGGQTGPRPQQPIRSYYVNHALVSRNAPSAVML